MPNDTPVFDDLLAAAARIAPFAVRTPVLRSPELDRWAGATLLFKAEHLQHVGAFKFRGACNAVMALDADTAARGVITHSSGNHGAALAMAAGVRGIPAHVVVPEGAVASKLANIQAQGATNHRCAATLAAREATTAHLQAQTGATLVHPYTDPRVIAGQGTAALELLAEAGHLDALLVPLGGGGLAGGSAIAAAGRQPGLAVFAAEPEGAADAFESLRQGRHVTDLVPDTLCDGLRATLGAPNLALLREHAVTVLLVSDTEVVAAMREAWMRLRQVIEPSSATVLAAVKRYPGHFAGKRIGLVLSGGNVDLDALPW
ncbi:MAG TPA: pyridoxal-phosphate dependent enzyme [Arenimonas sp.]|nr:pyridoxal-phosphate dependent enzyme [Arenimonas sp.]